MKIASAVKRTIATSTAALMLLGMTACGSKNTDISVETPTDSVEQPTYSAAPGSVSKSETVYVNINNDGSVSNVSVTDWIHTDKGEVCVNDISNLKDIVNVKSDLNPIADGEKLAWNMKDTDLYYSGTTKQKPPVELNLKYYLDGKEMKAKDIAGKSGKVKIEINMKNNLSKEVEVNGEKHKVYLPVAVVGGMILSESNFSGVQINGGKSIGDGTKEIAVVVGIPGMSESLGIDKLGITDIDGLILGNSASITAEAKNFEVGNMYFAAIPISSLNLNIDTGDSVEDLKSALAVIKQVQSSLTSMDPTQLMKTFTASSSESDSILSVLGDAAQLYSSNKALIDVLSKYATPDNSAQLRKLVEFFISEDTVKAITILSDSSVTKFLANLADLGDVVPVTNSLLADLQKPEVQAAVRNLPDTIEKLNKIQTVVAENADAVDYVMSLLSGDSLDSITKIVSMLEGIDFGEFEEKYSAIAANADVIVTKCEEWINYGKEYKLFTKAADNMTTSVLFVYMTPAIEKQVELTTVSSNEGGESILDSFIKKFR